MAGWLTRRRQPSFEIRWCPISRETGEGCATFQAKVPTITPTVTMRVRYDNHSLLLRGILFTMSPHNIKWTSIPRINTTAHAK